MWTRQGENKPFSGLWVIVGDRGMEQPCLTLSITAHALVSHGPHPASVYCFQSRQFPCHAWRIASSSVYFSFAAYSWLPGLASWLQSLFSSHIESGCVLLHQSLHVCESVKEEIMCVHACVCARVCVCWGREGSGNFSERVIKKCTLWDGWKQLEHAIVTLTSSELGTQASTLHDKRQLTFLCLSFTWGLACSRFVLHIGTR